jgi:hypothetical protein
VNIADNLHVLNELIRVSAILKEGASKVREDIHNERLSKEVSHLVSLVQKMWAISQGICSFTHSIDSRFSTILLVNLDKTMTKNVYTSLSRFIDIVVNLKRKLQLRKEET